MCFSGVRFFILGLDNVLVLLAKQAWQLRQSIDPRPHTTHKEFEIRSADQPPDIRPALRADDPAGEKAEHQPKFLRVAGTACVVGTVRKSIVNVGHMRFLHNTEYWRGGVQTGR